MRDEQDASALVGKAAEVLQRSLRQLEVEAGGRLVGDYDLRIVHERATEQHATGHAAGELMGIPVGDLGRQAVPLEQLRKPCGTPAGAKRQGRLCLGVRIWGQGRLCLGMRAWGEGRPPPRTRLPAHSCVAFDLSSDPHEGVEVVHALRHQGDAVAAQAGQRGGVLLDAVEPDAALHRRVGFEHPHDRVGEQGLARPRRPHDGYYLACMDADVQVVYDRHGNAPRPEEARLVGIVHREADAQAFDLEKVVSLRVAGRRRVGVTVMHRLACVVLAMCVTGGRIICLIALRFFVA